MNEPELLFVPLGGVGEIGMNLALYGFGAGDKVKWIIVDCGITFAEGASLPGIDVIMPDTTFIEERRKSLLGMVLTHGHEDHIGAVLDLWPDLGCKIYTTPFTAGLLTAKAREEQNAPKLPLHIVPKGGRITLGPFDIEFLPVSHSIPESHALAIRTPVGNVLHTGDWKIDPTPPLGDITDLNRFAAFGAEGVDVLIGDSTNAVREGRSPSEAAVEAALEPLIANAPGRVAVTLFASNIGRVGSIARAAKKAGRDVVVLGRALERNIGVARELGYLDDVPAFLDMEAYGYLPREHCLALMTGSQGEERSAIARVARGEHPHVAMSKGDRVIFSSRTIPGNERAVGFIQNGLVKQGVELITDRTHLVHVSGHPRADEMRELYDVVKPKCVMPVHGEAVHLDTHARLAKSWGVPETLIVNDGSIVRLAPGPAKVIDIAISGRLLKDGKLLLVEDEDEAVPQRRKLQYAGIVSVAVALNAKGEIVDEARIETCGVPELGLSGASMRSIIEDAVWGCVESLPKARRKDRQAVEEALKRSVRSAVDQAWGKKPLTHIFVMLT